MTMRENLGPLYILSGPVVHGLGNGHKVNMPTANLAVAPGRHLPPFGVYAALVLIGEKEYIGVTNVGLRPSLDENEMPTVETFILDFSGDLYGMDITLKLFAFLRPTRKMHSLSDVQAQVMQDAKAARFILGDKGQISKG